MQPLFREDDDRTDEEWTLLFRRRMATRVAIIGILLVISGPLAWALGKDAFAAAVLVCIGIPVVYVGYVRYAKYTSQLDEDAL